MTGGFAGARQLLVDLGSVVRAAVIDARDGAVDAQALRAVSAETAADTIYEFDVAAEHAVVAFLADRWPADQPVSLVMEGLEEALIIPSGAVAAWRLIVDPVDGTRPIMYDKRSAWFLAGLAPERGAETSLADIEVAAMVELPTTRARWSREISGERGIGPDGVIVKEFDVVTGDRRIGHVRPSTAVDLAHGFSSVAKFFPAAKAELARFETELFAAVSGSATAPMIFDDQYLASGGQLHELLCGHDRFIADVRPLAHRSFGIEPISAHPYDLCTWILAAELGVIVECPDGRPLSAPLDLTSNVAWVGYANEVLASTIRPQLQRLLRLHFPADGPPSSA